MAVHAVINFAWKHYWVNIHSAMMVDILHQLLKGIVKRLLDWTENLEKELTGSSTKSKDPRGVKQKRGGKLVKDSSYSFQLDERFWQVPNFHKLKRFPDFSKVQKWTSNEQKAMVKQLVPVLASILTAKSLAAMHYTKAALDFVMLAMYISHTNQTLSYMAAALARLDLLKKVFQISKLTSCV